MQVLDDALERRAGACHWDAQDLCDRGRDELGVDHGGQRNEVHAGGEILERLGRDLKAQARLADAARAGQRQKTRVLQQPLTLATSAVRPTKLVI